MIKLCEVPNCEREHHAKGYCRRHYERLKRGGAIVPKCAVCGKIIPQSKKRLDKYCSKECAHKGNLEVRKKYDATHKKERNLWRKKYYLRNRERLLKYRKDNFIQGNFCGRSFSVYTNGATEEMRRMLPMIKKKVMEDCIRNPRKYLDG